MALSFVAVVIFFLPVLFLFLFLFEGLVAVHPHFLSTIDGYNKVLPHRVPGGNQIIINNLNQIVYLGVTDVLLDTKRSVDDIGSKMEVYPTYRVLSGDDGIDFRIRRATFPLKTIVWN